MVKNKLTITPCKPATESKHMIFIEGFISLTPVHRRILKKHFKEFLNSSKLTEELYVSIWRV